MKKFLFSVAVGLLLATQVDAASIHLQWAYWASVPVDAFLVYRRVNAPGTYLTLGSWGWVWGPTARAYTDTTAEAGISYCYSIRAHRALPAPNGEQSDFTEEVCGRSLPTPSAITIVGEEPQ